MGFFNLAYYIRFFIWFYLLPINSTIFHISFTIIYSSTMVEVEQLVILSSFNTTDIYACFCERSFN